jgi:uncharacterized membrane protein required for colicin V production
MFIDILLLSLFVVITGVGFFQGTIKLTIALITFYASVILASLYFKFLALYMSRRGTSPIVADAVSFFIILAVCFALLLAMSLYTFRYVRIPGKLEYVDRIFGVVLGVVLGVVSAGVLAMVLQFAFVSHSAGNEYPISRFVQNSTRSSTLQRVMIVRILPQLYTSVSPFLPDAAVPFFNPSRA